MQNKKRFFSSFFIILFIAIFMLIFAYEKKDQFLFNHFVKDFTKQALSENALDLHYTLKEPQNYGIYDVSTLPIYRPMDALSSYQDYQNTLLSLEKIESIVKRISAYDRSRTRTINNGIQNGRVRVHKNKIYAPALHELIHYRKLPPQLLDYFGDKRFRLGEKRGGGQLF